MSHRISHTLRQLVYAAGYAVIALSASQSAWAADKVTTTVTDTSEPSDDEALVKDPYERFNRDTFALNDALDTNLLQPVARFYNKIMPTPLNQGIHNFFLNLNTVTTVADDFLQFNFYQMANDAWRLVINTTLGVGGLFDVATRMNLKYYENDFGMTLATWGYRKSNYLVLPFYGSYMLRDGLALPVDFFLLSAYKYIEPRKLAYGIQQDLNNRPISVDSNRQNSNLSIGLRHGEQDA
jgi:phospholipid-binding lipoprotein MlaA